MEPIFEFGPFRLDVRERRLLHRGAVVPLRAKVFDTLRVLVERHGRLVRKAELMSLVWPDAVVEENNVALNVTLLRKAFRGVGGAASLIETVPGQGYRFTAEVLVLHNDGPQASAPVEVRASTSGAPDGGGPSLLLERETELDTLASALEAARAGQRRFLSIGGEAGIGKTVLVTHFLAPLEGADDVLLARGQCVEHVGECEAYLPVLDALSNAARAQPSSGLLDALTRYAPTWLVQMPCLTDDRTLANARERALGGTSERMIRELAELLEAVGEHRTVVLALEDLHWADPSTTSLLTALARRQRPARLLVIATHRGHDGGTAGLELEANSLELELRGLATVLRPAPLSADAIRALLAARTSGAPVEDELVAMVAKRTNGNPLFATTLLEYWHARDLLATGPEALAHATPDSLRSMIQRKLEGLSPSEAQTLEVASVVGHHFTAAAVAAAGGVDIEEVDEIATSLAVRGAIVRREGPGYTFTHALHHEALYQRISPVRRARLHLSVARHLESRASPRLEERASELSHHFAAGEDFTQAAAFAKLAAEHALEKSAHREAAVHLRRALTWVDSVEPATARAEIELTLHALLAPTLVALEGYASAEAERSFLRARALGERLGDTERLFPLLYGQAMVHELRGEYERTEAVLLERLALTPGDQNPDRWVDSETLMACSLFHQGRFQGALEHAESGTALYEAERHRTLMAMYGENPGVACRGWAALSLWFLGQPDEAVRRIEDAVRLGREPGHLFSLSAAMVHGTHLHQLRGDVERTAQWAEETLRISVAQGYAYNVAFAKVLLGWARLGPRAEADALGTMEEGLATLRGMSAHLDQPYLLALLAEVHLRGRRLSAAREALTEAFALIRRGRTFFYEVELLRLEAELTQATSGDREEVERLLARAGSMAREQGSRALELRVALSAAKHRRDTTDLRRIYDTFREGHDTSDLAEARSLLESRT